MSGDDLDPGARRGVGNTPYRRPDPDVMAIVDAPPPPVVSTSPDGTCLLLAHYEALPPIEQIAERWLGLAGLRFHPRLHEWRRAYYFHRFEIQDVATSRTRPIDAPPASRMSRPHFSPDGKTLVFTRTVDEGVELWVADVASGATRRLLQPIVNDTMGGACAWISDQPVLLVRTRVPGTEPPALPRVPVGPHVEDTAGREAANRTFQDLLKDAHDEALFDHYFTSQLARVGLDGGVERVGEPGVFLDAMPSPDGRWLWIERVVRPYSHTVPIYRFARALEAWDAHGGTVVPIAQLPVMDAVPIQGVPEGPRSAAWLPREPATLCFARALDGGDPRRAAEFRDELFTTAAPFASPPVSAGRVKQRFIGLDFVDEAALALVSEWDRDRRWVTTSLRDLLDAERAPAVLFDRSLNDVYGDPGQPVSRRLPAGGAVARVENGCIFLTGEGATPEGDRPFLDRFDLATRTTVRLFRSEADRHASFVQFVRTGDGPAEGMLVRRESRTEPPNLFLFDRAGVELRAITALEDPHPQLTGIRKELLTYPRADGVTLSGTLHVPPHWDGVERLPLVIWAYPQEFSDAATAGQISAQPNRFTRLSGISPLFFLLRGFAVLEDATMPVIGAPETVNDTFVKQVVDSAQAAIDACVARGVADRDRVGVGGHSYGAFMAVTLLAWCDLFKAAVARSGAYNRTLTPFGFQGERRTLWQARDTYLTMSPFLHADRIGRPLLLIHGEVDDNPGTFPMQSRRLFHALSGLKGHCRLVILPHEAHGYAARESVHHVLAESLDWFLLHVKGTASPGSASDTD